MGGRKAESAKEGKKRSVIAPKRAMRGSMMVKEMR